MIGKTNAVVGGGGSAVPMEKVNVTLTSNQSSSEDLLGATITLSYGSYSEDFVWDGKTLTFSIMQYITYTLSFSSVSGYKTPASLELVAIADNVRQIDAQYQTEVVTVTVSADSSVSVSGQTVTINGVTTTLTATGVVSQKIPYGTSYSVSVSSLSGYNTPATQTFTASQATRSVSVVYEEIRLGVFIQDTTGRLWTVSSWNKTATPNGVAVITSDCEFVIALTQTAGIPISLSGIRTLSVSKFPTAPAEDYSGKANTEKLVQALGSDTSLAAGYCTTFTFPNGKRGYLGSAGEWMLVHNNLSAVNQCLKAVGSQMISVVKHWTSTRAEDLGDYCCFWAIEPKSATFTYHYTYYYIDELTTRPFTTL